MRAYVRNSTRARVADRGRLLDAPEGTTRDFLHKTRRMSPTQNAKNDRQRAMPGPPVEPARSRLMAAVRQKGTRPELIVRRCLRKMGLRYRCNCPNLPGSPDVILTTHKLAIFVHGCFWHGHHCRYGTIPVRRREWWTNKFAENNRRDQRARRKLRLAGWKVAVIWECWTREPALLEKRIARIMIKNN